MRLACALALLHAAAAGAASLRRGSGRHRLEEAAAATFRAHRCNGSYADCETPQLSADVRGLVDSNVTGSAIKLLRGATDHDLQEDASRQWRDLKFDLPPPPRRSRQTRRPPRPPARLKEPAPKPKPDCSDEPHPDPDQDPCHGAFVGEKNLAEAQRRMEALEEDSRRAMVRRRERELDEARTVAMRLRGEPVQDEYPPKRFHKRPSWFPPPGWERIRKRRIPGMRTFQTGEEGLQW